MTANYVDSLVLDAYVPHEVTGKPYRPTALIEVEPDTGVIVALRLLLGDEVSLSEPQPARGRGQVEFACAAINLGLREFRGRLPSLDELKHSLAEVGGRYNQRLLDRTVG